MDEARTIKQLKISKDPTTNTFCGKSHGSQMVKKIYSTKIANFQTACKPAIMQEGNGKHTNKGSSVLINRTGSHGFTSGTHKGP